MDCYLCTPDTKDENTCQTCAAMLQPAVEMMTMATKDPRWKESNTPFKDMEIIDSVLVLGIIMGAQLSFTIPGDKETKRIDGKAVFSIERIEKVPYNFVPFSEHP